MRWLSPRQQIDWPRRRMGLVIAIAVVLLDVLDSRIDLDLFGYDVFVFVGAGLIGLAGALMIRLLRHRTRSGHDPDRGRERPEEQPWGG